MARASHPGRVARKAKAARFLLISAALSLAAGVALADPLGDAKGGMDALNKGDNDMAIRLFSQAINSGGLAQSDLELAYVKRAQAYAAEKNALAASDDLDAAAKLDPNDREVAELRRTLQRGVKGGPTIAETLNYVRDHVLAQSPLHYTASFAGQMVHGRHNIHTRMVDLI